MWKCCLIACWLSQVFLVGREREEGVKRMTLWIGKPLFQRIMVSIVTSMDELDEIFLGLRAKKRHPLLGLSLKSCGSGQ